MLAATALKDWLAEQGLPGRVRYYGCPAEEGGAAKAFDWDEFKQIDWSLVYNVMRKPAVIFDGRRVLSIAELKKIGFKVHSVGQGPELQDNVWV